MAETWRTVPFEKGRRYRVRKSFDALRDAFGSGEILSYAESCYSHYDEYTGFLFIDEESKRRVWDLHDLEPIERCAELFEPL